MTIESFLYGSVTNRKLLPNKEVYVSVCIFSNEHLYVYMSNIYIT